MDAEPHAALLTVPEVARVLRVSRSDVYRKIRRGELPVFQNGSGQGRGKEIRVARADLVEFLRRRRIV